MISEWLESDYAPRNRQEVQAALRQILQQVALAGLFRAGFFEHAAFYGGTALRIFYGLPRFSEDLDFSLLSPNREFSLSPYLQTLEKEFQAAGITVSTRIKEKPKESEINTAFVNSTTLIRELLVETNPYHPTHKEITSVKIKLELDINPPLNFRTEEKLMLKPFSCYIKCFAPEDLMAVKLHALLFRGWKNRVKGRDWYDIEWYIKQGIEVNLHHLQRRMVHSGDRPQHKPLTREDLRQMLLAKTREVNFAQASNNVRPFLKDASGLRIWSPQYFKDVFYYLKTR